MTTNTERIEVTTTDPVTEELLGWSEAAVKHLARSCEGLTDAQTRAPVAPSGWSVLGLLGHVRDTTLFWLTNVIAGRPTTMGADDCWDNNPAAAAAEVIDRVLGDVERACAATRGVSSTAAPGWWPTGAWGGYRQDTVRAVLLHLLNDNVAHAGHLDLAREGIDGAVWDFAVNGVRVPLSTTVGMSRHDREESS